MVLGVVWYHMSPHKSKHTHPPVLKVSVEASYLIATHFCRHCLRQKLQTKLSVCIRLKDRKKGDVPLCSVFRTRTLDLKKERGG